MSTAHDRIARSTAESEGSGRRPLTGSPHRLNAERRRVRRRGLSSALLLMLLGAAGAVYLSAQGESRIEVVALARPVARGHILTEDDLATIQVSVDGGRARLSTPTVAAAAIVGRAVLADLAAGQPMSPELVAAATPVDPGTVAVGVRLSSDALPADQLRSGEWVRIVRTDGSTGQAQELVSRAVVLSSVSPATDGLDPDADTVVRLAVPLESADAVAGAASVNGGLRLLGVTP